MQEPSTGLPRVRITPDHLEFDGQVNTKRPLVLFCARDDSTKSQQKVAFKIQTNVPTQYSVKPVQGVLTPGESRVIQVLFKETPQASPRQGAQSQKQDKFLIRFAWLDIATARNPVEAHIPADFWTKVPKSEIAKAIVPSWVPLIGTQRPGFTSENQTHSPSQEPSGPIPLEEIIKPHTMDFIMDLLVKNLSRKKGDRLEDNELEILLNLREQADPYQWEKLQSEAKQQRKLRILHKRQHDYEVEVNSEQQVGQRLKLVNVLLSNARTDISNPSPNRISQAVTTLKRALGALRSLPRSNQVGQLEGMVLMELGFAFRLREQKAAAIDNLTKSAHLLQENDGSQEAISKAVASIVALFHDMGKADQAHEWEQFSGESNTPLSTNGASHHQTPSRNTSSPVVVSAPRVETGPPFPLRQTVPSPHRVQVGASGHTSPKRVTNAMSGYSEPGPLRAPQALPEGKPITAGVSRSFKPRSPDRPESVWKKNSGNEVSTVLRGAGVMRPTQASESQRLGRAKEQARQQANELAERRRDLRLAKIQPVSPSSPLLRPTSSSVSSRIDRDQRTAREPSVALVSANPHLVVTAQDVIAQSTAMQGTRVRSYSSPAKVSARHRRQTAATSKHYRRARLARQLRAKYSGKAADPLYPEISNREGREDARQDPLRQRTALWGHRSPGGGPAGRSLNVPELRGRAQSVPVRFQLDGRPRARQSPRGRRSTSRDYSRRRSDSRDSRRGGANQQENPGRRMEASQREMPCPVQVYSHQSGESVYTALPGSRTTDAMRVGDITRLLAVATGMDPDDAEDMVLVMGSQFLDDPNALGKSVGIKPHTFFELRWRTPATFVEEREPQKKLVHDGEVMREVHSELKALGKDAKLLRKSCTILKDQVKLDFSVVGLLFAERVTQLRKRSQEAKGLQVDTYPPWSQLPEDLMDQEGPLRSFAVLAPSKLLYDQSGECHVSVSNSKREIFIERNEGERQLHVFNGVLEASSHLDCVGDLHTLCLLDIVDDILDGKSANVIVTGDRRVNRLSFVLGESPIDKSEEVQGKDGLLVQVTNDLLHWLGKSGTSSPRDPKVRASRYHGAGQQFMVTVTAVELTVNGPIVDLLKPQDEEGPEPQIQHDHQGRVFVSNLIAVQIHKVGDIDMVNDVIRKRLDRSSSPNARVRMRQAMSHCVVTVEVIQQLEDPSHDPIVSKLTFVILAEHSALLEFHNHRVVHQPRLRQQQVVATTQQPASLKDIRGLIDVLSSISREEQQHPYRNSRLTTMLQNVLGLDSSTVLVAVVDPSPSCDDGTARTLGFVTLATSATSSTSTVTSSPLHHQDNWEVQRENEEVSSRNRSFSTGKHQVVMKREDHEVSSRNRSFSTGRLLERRRQSPSSPPWK